MARALAIMMVLMLGTLPAAGWDGATTHAGLAEQSAMSSHLSRVLVGFGYKDGLFTELTLPRQANEQLYALADRLNPIHGYVPDKSGTQSALAWVALGAAVANMVGEGNRHHFFDPAVEQGLGNGTIRPAMIKRLTVKAATTRAIAGSGKSAVQWLIDPNNTYNIAVVTAKWQEVKTSEGDARQAKLAEALVGLGAVLHVLHDMAQPAMVRNDLASFYDRIDRASPAHRGSRFEAIAVFAFGRLGVPAGKGAIPAFASWQEYFKNDNNSGLAQLTATRWFSENTMPRDFKVQPGKYKRAPDLSKSMTDILVRPKPRPPTNLDVIRAETQVAKIINKRGACVLEYQVIDYTVRWQMSDRCMLGQQKELLPLAAHYGAGLINLLTAAYLPKGKPKSKESKRIKLLPAAGKDTDATDAKSKAPREASKKTKVKDPVAPATSDPQKSEKKGTDKGKKTPESKEKKPGPKKSKSAPKSKP